MIYHFSLQAAGLAAGALLIVFGLIGFLSPARAALPRFPRSRAAGAILLTIDFAWSFWLLATMEMGEFANLRRPLLFILPVGFVLVLKYVDELLAVRALGIFCLLAAEPLLDAAFLRPEMSRLLVTVLAYLLIVAGLLWVTMPYLLRDQIAWSTRSAAAWRTIAGLGLVLGLMIATCAVWLY
jgi:hypothetical protein